MEPAPTIQSMRQTQENTYMFTHIISIPTMIIRVSMLRLFIAVNYMTNNWQQQRLMVTNMSQKSTYTFTFSIVAFSLAREDTDTVKTCIAYQRSHAKCSLCIRRSMNPSVSQINHIHDCFLMFDHAVATNHQLSTAGGS